MCKLYWPERNTAHPIRSIREVKRQVGRMQKQSLLSDISWEERAANRYP